VWQSAQIGVNRSFVRDQVGPASREQVRTAIQKISGESPAGPIKEMLVRGLARRPELVSLEQVIRSVSVEGRGLDAEARAALGAEQALRLQRVAPASVDDWRIIVELAIDAGLTFERGWSARWDEFNKRLGWLGSHRRATAAQRSLAFTLAAVVADELERRGLPVAMIDQRPGISRISTHEACMSALQEAARRAPPGRLSWSKIEKALADRKDQPTMKQINLALSRRGIPKETALRLALGRTAALRSGRVVAKTRGEWVTVLSAAIDDGFMPGRGWGRRWDELRLVHPRYVSYRTVSSAVQEYGGFNVLYEAASQTSPPGLGSAGAARVRNFP
jgi:hypothetical protein